MIDGFETMDGGECHPWLIRDSSNMSKSFIRGAGNNVGVRRMKPRSGPGSRSSSLKPRPTDSRRIGQDTITSRLSSPLRRYVRSSLLIIFVCFASQNLPIDSLWVCTAVQFQKAGPLSRPSLFSSLSFVFPVPVEGQDNNHYANTHCYYDNFGLYGASAAT